jgi:hypothetical protein
VGEKTKLLYYGLWFAHPVLQLGIAALMLQRGLFRKFKFFFGYVLTQLITFSVLFPSFWYQSQALFYIYWGCTAISVAFGFGVIYEVFVDVFRAFHTLRDLGTVLFKWAGLVMLLVAAVVALSNTTTDLAPWMQAIFTAQKCVRIIQVGMVLFLLFFAQYLGVSRRQHSFGLALGFGVFAFVELGLIASLVGNHLGNPWMSIVNMAAYNCTLMVWLGYVAVKSPSRETAASLLQSQRWEQSLTDIHHPVQPDSLIPMFEDMVDRALSRTSPEVPLVRESRMVDRSFGASAFSGLLDLPRTRYGSKS